MPRRNRVDPWGDLHAVEGRGMFTGNRGCLVDGRGRIVHHHRSSLWITCLTEFRGWRHPLAEPGRWTPIFFLDDVVALAAGHRPCGLCRRDDYRRYRDAVTFAAAAGVPQRSRDRPNPTDPDRRAWVGGSPLLATDLNRLLASERLRRGSGVDRAADRRTWTADVADLPDATVIVDADHRPRVLLGDRTLAFTLGGWSSPARRPTRGLVQVLTPPTSVAALANGFMPRVHRSAHR